jgi:genome maintenance exonuclease 1
MFNYCPPKQLQDLNSETFPDGKRYYTLPDGTRLPSVTTVLGAQKKDAIIAWRKRVGEEEANRVSKKATSRGTGVHTLCEYYLNNETNLSQKEGVRPDAFEMFVSLKPLLNRINNIWYQEQALWSKKLELAGRVDCIAEFDGVLSIIDFKTSKKIKTKNMIEDYYWQECAYALMLEEMIGEPVHQLVTIMAVEDEQPLLFIEKTEDHIHGLVKAIQFYKEQK